MKFREIQPIVNRDTKAKDVYLSASKEERKHICYMATCDDNSCQGLLMSYMMFDFERLKKIRERKVNNKVDRYRRLVDYYNVIYKIAQRNSK